MKLSPDVLAQPKPPSSRYLSGIFSFTDGAKLSYWTPEDPLIQSVYFGFAHSVQVSNLFV